MANFMTNFGDVPTVTAVVPVATFTSDTNGSAIDIRNYTGEAAVIMQCTAGSGNMTCNVKLQASADGSTSWADITGAAFTAVTTTASTQKISINTNETDRYIRAVVDVGGTTPSFVLGVSVLGITG